MTSTLHKLFDPAIFEQCLDVAKRRVSEHLETTTSDSINPIEFISPSVMQERVTKPFPQDLNLDRFDGLLEIILKSATYLHSPRFMGHQVSAPAPIAAMTEMVTSLLNNGMAIYEMGQASTAVEKHIIQWMAEKIGWQSGAEGVFTSGGSLGNLTALLAARQAKMPGDVWQNGGGTDAVIFTGPSSHYSIDRACRIMGLGEHGSVVVDGDAKHHMCSKALEKAIVNARDKGRVPIAVVVSSCSTTIGAFDSIPEIVDVAKRHDLWVHVDGAHGASALVSEKHKHLLRGVEDADSVVWDAHKLMHVPALCTAVIFKDGAHSYGAFAQKASYLFSDNEDELASYNVGKRTVECTKKAMAMNLWVLLQVFGTDVIEESVDRLFCIASEFADLVDEDQRLSLAVRPESNIVCFRLNERSDEFQSQVRAAMLRAGDFYIVETKFDGQQWLRCTFMNPLTRTEHLKEMISVVHQIADSI